MSTLTIGDLNVLISCVKTDLGEDHPLWGDYVKGLVTKLEDLKYEEIKRINTEYLAK